MAAFPGVGNEADPIMKFWSDVMASMGGSASRGPSADDVMRQMRQAFFEAWGRQCEDFMKSEAFLEMMKTSMDHALTFREKTNEFLNKALNDTQMPSREDTDSILVAVRTLQEEVLHRLEDLSKRVTVLEERVGRAAGAKKGGK